MRRKDGAPARLLHDFGCAGPSHLTRVFRADEQYHPGAIAIHDSLAG